MSQQLSGSPLRLKAICLSHAFRWQRGLAALPCAFVSTASLHGAKLAIRLHALQSRDTRIGFEASNQ